MHPTYIYYQLLSLNKNYKRMKKIFTLIAIAMMVLCTQAQTLINYPADKTGITISGTTTEGTVKIHANKDAVACLTLKNGFLTDELMNGNHIKLEVEGGFKAGDVVTIAGAISNADESKRGTVNLFTAGNDKVATSLIVFEDFINARLVEDDPVEQTYTLEADADSLFLGRDGNTGTNLTLIKVVRPGGTDPDPEPGTETGSSIDYPTKKDGITLMTTDAAQVSYSSVKINENSTSVDCIKFGKSYKYAADEYYYATLTVEGGFKANDIITIAGVYNNKDEKNAAIAFRSDPESEEALWTTENFINGQKVADAPEAQQYILTEDAATLYFGRAGNTGTCVTLLKVERKTSDGIKTLNVTISNATIYNLAGQQVTGHHKGIAIRNGKKVVLK